MNKGLLILLLLLNSQVCISQKSQALDSLGLEVKAQGNTLASIQSEFHALGGAVERVDEKVSQYYDMFKHQWTVFGVLLTALSLVIVVFIPLAGLYSYRSFRREIAENAEVFNLRIESIEGTVKANQDATKNAKVDLLEKVANTNRMIYLNSSYSAFGYSAAFTALELYIDCYREMRSNHFDVKINEAASFLFLSWDDNPDLRGV